MHRWLAFAAASEALTGVALLVAPSTVLRLLLGGSTDDAGLLVARLAGIALVALGIACWPDPHPAACHDSAYRAMCAYGLTAAVYLAALGLRGQATGWLLWPAVLLHVALTVALALAWSNTRRNDGAGE